MYRIIISLATLLLTQASLIAAGEDPHWDYKGTEGPEKWGELAPEYDMCAKGRNQSPINLVADYHADLPELDLQYTKPGRDP